MKEYSPEQAAKIVGVASWRIKDWINRGRLRHSKDFDETVTIPHEYLVHFLRECGAEDIIQKMERLQ